jgi:hypothetical protein
MGTLMPKTDVANLTNEPDVFVCKLTTTGVIFVKSMYEYLLNVHTRFSRKHLWN